jgi:transcription-repair coupling factor (superfamily II helicase)
MNLSNLLEILRSHHGYDQLIQSLELAEPRDTSLGLLNALRTPFVASLSRDISRPMLYLVPRADRLLTRSEELPLWYPQLEIKGFPDPGPLFYEWAPWSFQVRNDRVAVLASMTCGLGPGAPPDDCLYSGTIFIASARGLMTRTITRRQFLAQSRYINRGQTVVLNQLLEFLVDSGYAHMNLVTDHGEFSRRGGILDIWPPSDPAPSRLDFFGNEIETLRTFDPGSQRSIEPKDWVRITPAREGLPRFYKSAWARELPQLEQDDPLACEERLELFLPLMGEQPASLLDYLPEDILIVFDDRQAFENTIEDLEEQGVAMRSESSSTDQLSDTFPPPYATLAEMNDALEQFQTVDLGSQSIEALDELNFSRAFNPGPRFGGQLNDILDHLLKQSDSHNRVIVLSRQAPRLQELWSNAESERMEDEIDSSPLLPGEVRILHGALSEGWQHTLEDNSTVELLTDAELFGWTRPRPRRRSIPRITAPEQAFADLTTGDYVVHVDFGIGQFQGLVDRTLDEVKREFLLIEYSDGDQLFVPVHQADRLTRYIGADGSPPALSRLGSADWERAKTRTRQAVEAIARDLLELYAKRQTVVGTAFKADTIWQRELEASFAHQETYDQNEALLAIKHDMESPRPMDRLICGDVGYGKTEVALRAAFKAVMHGKQVAMLVPTTVLAQQHYETFQRRIGPFPVEIEMLSRFRSRTEASQILEHLSAGDIDIVIGTHRLLQADVQFKDLGLLIIDEEQRFGVTHKEFLKKMRTEVDVLTLTATPIPRTLYMALTGARDISTISTPPEDRLPIITHVGPYKPKIIRAAILRELDRGGQVFFVHNRVQTINKMNHRLERLVPEARFAIAHGQMPEHSLASVMEAFSRGDIDILVSTSIIESGLDIPNANTLIVDRADRFGLAQLYQLRGRVGRAAIQGYAYFFRPAGVRSTEESIQRLEILAEHSHLGAGYAIAMRDLEMRGAGEILGTRQHGYINTVGFHLYTRLLASAVRRMRGSTLEATHLPPELLRQAEKIPATVDLPIHSVIPEDYIPEKNFRLQLYRRIAEISDYEQINRLDLELEDRFGSIPTPVRNLLFQLQIKLMATDAGIERIASEGTQIVLEIPEERIIPELELASGVFRRSKRGIWVGTTEQSWRDNIERILHAMRNEIEFVSDQEL